ncbi:hypothetical protein QBC39DRAFT_400198 [Podospora conica]|nr:hypothetical protein QBC39DRAFT_400198 [Schizothecium conicum]
METLSRLLRRQPPPPTVPTDRIIPLHFFENSPLVQGNNMAATLVFDEVLDPEKLRTSLEALVTRDGWHRLGGRLRKNPSGTIEWHIPTTFPPSRPPLTFTHTTHTQPTTTHPIARLIPSPSTTDLPSIIGNPDDLAPLAWDDDNYRPAGIADYLTADRPVLGLRVHSFPDKTLVVLQWQHVAFDALGLGYVVENWARMLHERGDEVPTPCGGEGDPFAVLATGAREAGERHVLADREVGGWGMVRWGVGAGVDMLVREKENRMVCVPEGVWRGEMERALRELRGEAEKKGEDVGRVFLTENDVVTAWVLRCVVVSKGMSPERTVNASIAMSLRRSFEGDLIPVATGQPYVGNAFGWANVLVSAGDVASKPLSWLACQLRRAINEQGTRAQHEAYYARVRESGMGLPIVIFGDGSMAQVGFSNWSKAGLFDVDFSPARKEAGKEGIPCRASYVQENHGPIKPANGFFVLGKDEKGNYWTSAYKVKGEWAAFEEQLREDFGRE